MPLLRNITTLYTCAGNGGQDAIHPIDGAAIVWEDETIAWVGPEADLPQQYGQMETIDAKGQLVIPGLIDSHTHLAFGGWRADEFEMRCRGATYLEIAKSGGGIASTVEATRAASQEDLRQRSEQFLQQMAALGVTTVECKSGYGQSPNDELKQLRVYRDLQESQQMTIVPTFLGAHIIPPEYKDNRERYMQLLREELIPQVADEGLAEFFDVFVEESAFTKDEARELFETAHRHGLAPKLHVDQLSDGGGGALAAEVEAVSADHLEHTSDEGIQAMASAGVVAGCLPLATLYLNEKPMRGRAFVEAGVPVAVATDFNPGSAPSFHLPLAMMLSCTLCGLTPAEALKGATLYAARSVGREENLGSLEAGKRADFALVDAPSVNHWLYHFRPNDITATYAGGSRISL